MPLPSYLLCFYPSSRPSLFLLSFNWDALFITFSWVNIIVSCFLSFSLCSAKIKCFFSLPSFSIIVSPELLVIPFSSASYWKAHTILSSPLTLCYPVLLSSRTLKCGIRVFFYSLPSSSDSLLFQDCWAASGTMEGLNKRWINLSPPIGCIDSYAIT